MGMKIYHFVTDLFFWGLVSQLVLSWLMSLNPLMQREALELMLPPAATIGQGIVGYVIVAIVYVAMAISRRRGDAVEF